MDYGQGYRLQDHHSIPSIPYGFSPRKRLTESLKNAFAYYPVVVISAPEGYGKTSLLAYELARYDGPVAWMRISHRITDASEFFRAFGAALQQASARLKPSSDRITDGEVTGAYRNVERLISSISTQAPNLYIVLDDYGLVDSEEVDNFIEALALQLPSLARLVIVTSQKPKAFISHLLLQGLSAELKTTDLAFTDDEAIELYETMNKNGLTSAAFERINSYMEGWPAGLRLADSSLRNGASIGAILAGEDEAQRSFFDYISSKLIEVFDDVTLEFLLRTSLFEEFNAELCDSVFGRADSNSCIQRIQESLPFIRPANAPGWYRYAGFFRQCLQRMAQTRGRDKRHEDSRRASTWFTEHDMYEQAGIQALYSEDYDLVIKISQKFCLTDLGQPSIERVAGLVQAIPQEIVVNSPWISVMAVVACEVLQEYVQQQAYIESALQHASLMSESGDESAAALGIVSMLRAYHHGESQKALEIGEKLLMRSEAASLFTRCSIHNLLGIAHWSLGEVHEAQRDWQESSNYALYLNWSYSICLSLYGIAFSHYMCGRYESAEETCQRIFAISNQGSEAVLSSGYAHLLLGRIYFERNQLDQAKNEAETARRIGAAGYETVMAMNAEMALARIDLAQGRKSDAINRANRSLSKLCSQQQYRMSFDEAKVHLAQIWLLANKPELAETYLSRFSDFDTTAPATVEEINARFEHDLYGSDFRQMWLEPPLINYFFSRIQTGDVDGVMEWLEYIQEETGRKGYGTPLAKTLILKAMCANAMGNTDAALGFLAQALTLCEPNGCTRMFVDGGKPMEQLLALAKRKRLNSRFVSTIISQQEAARSASDADASCENVRFTRREREIVQHLRNGATNEEIAKSMYLGLSTVKNHIRNIYMKLGARNRAEAIAKIHEFDL